MFEFIRRHSRIFLFALLILIIPGFIVASAYQYMQSSDANTTVARIGGGPFGLFSAKITQPEWDASFRNQVDRARQQMPNVPSSMFDTPAFRRQALDELVRERVMLRASSRLNLMVSDDRLQTVFKSDPQFSFLRNPDGTVNRTALAAQGMSAEQFEGRLRQDMAMRQVLLGIATSVVAPAAATNTALDALFQQREVQVQRFDAKDYVAKVDPTDADIDKFYADPMNAARFEAPETASIEYVMLDLDALKTGITVPDEELRKNYEQNIARYSSPEERRASHILFKAEKSMPAPERAKVKAQADSVLAQLQKNPKTFAELAKRFSADPGSAEKGGDLDFFPRGAMVKPFEDTAFSLKPGQMSALVESDFGYHIIMVTGQRGGTTRGFESVKPELLEQVRTQLAQQRYAEAAEAFTNTVYEQADSLQPVADKLKLKVRTAPAVTRTPASDAVAPLNNPKFLDALFGGDSLRNKRNTEAVETGPNQLVSGRIVKYDAAHKLPLAEVKTKVRETLVATMAAELARKDGEARLAALKQATPGAAPMTGDTKVISRMQTQGFAREIVDAALGVDTAKLPALAGADLGIQGYAIVQVGKVLPRDPATVDPASAASQYAQVWGGAEIQAYYAALKTRQKAVVLAADAPQTTEATIR